MENTVKINLNGNRSLIDNKAHIDENWEKFTKNNSPYLRDSLVPHYVKEVNKEIPTNIAFDSKGNKYYVNNNKFYINDEAFTDISSNGFNVTDLEENYECYDVNGPAYILNNVLFYGDYNYQFNYDILFSRVRVFDDSAYFIIVYYDGDNILSRDIVIIVSDGTIKTDTKQISWGQLEVKKDNDDITTSWKTVTDTSTVKSFRCNIALLKGNSENAGDTCVGFTLIGNASSHNKESELYFYNSIYDIDEDRFFSGSEINWVSDSGSVTIENSWQVPYTVTHTRVIKNNTQKYYTINPVAGATNGYFFSSINNALMYRSNQLHGSAYPEAPRYYSNLPIGFQTESKETSSSKWYEQYSGMWKQTTSGDGTIVRERTAYWWEVTDIFTITITEASNIHTNSPQTFTLTYMEGDVEKTLEGTMNTTQTQITLQQYNTSYVMDTAFENKINALLSSNLVSLEVSQTIDEVEYVKSIPLENITFTPDTLVEEYEGFTTGINHGVVYTINLTKNDGSQTYLTWQWSKTQPLSATKTVCNLFEDNGNLRSVPIYEYRGTGDYDIKIKEYIVLGSISSINIDNNNIDLKFLAVRQYNSLNDSPESNYIKFASSCYTLNQNFFEVLFALTDTNYSEKNTHNFYTNTGLQQEIIGDIGVLFDPSKEYTQGASVGKFWYNDNGAISPINNTKWRLLYNYGNITNISYGEMGEEGSILCDWNMIDDLFYISYNETNIVYKDVNGIHKISIEQVNDNVQIFENNYVLINTTSYLNCYDIRNKKMIHFASDFNDRCYNGWRASSYGFFLDEDSWKHEWESNKWDSESSQIAYACGQNINYEISGNPIVSASFPYKNYYHVVRGKEYYCFGNNAEVDVYYALTYNYTIRKNNSVYINSNLYPDAQYPISTTTNYFNLPLLLTLIKTYNNKDMVKSGTLFYPIMYYNDNIPIFVYSTLGGLEGATNMFVIQSQYYAVMGGKICAVSYSDNVIANVEAIIDVNGMEFVGYLPTFALFYSPKNKCIYSFTGDANLEKMDDASEIGYINHAVFNTFTETIHVLTDKGVCIIGDTVYMIEYPSISEIFFTEHNTILETEDKLYMLSFEKRDEDYKVLPLIFETEFYGADNEAVTTVSQWSMRFIKDVVNNGKIKLTSILLTDKGSESIEKVFDVTNKDWDKLTDSLYIQYSPANNKGVGHKIRIESDFPLTSLIARVNSDGSLGSARNSLKI
jgi:hypothetical protein